jgi:hypothetical protein
LARQLLLQRHPVTVLAAIDRLVGLQAQAVVTPHESLPQADQSAVEAEALRLLDFVAADLDRRDLVWS